MELLFNPTTKTQLINFIDQPYQGLLIVGQRGSGKTATINWLAATLLGVSINKLENNPYVLSIQANEKEHILIDTIRDSVVPFLAVKVPGRSNEINRVVLIDDAENLTLDAQNALLKILEEPPQQTVIILSTSNPEQLLPTIKSRTRIIRILPPSKIELNNYMQSQGIGDETIKHAISLSGGLIGLALAVANDQKEHSLYQASIIARKLLSSTTYDRLTLINDITKNESLLRDILTVIQYMSLFALQSGNNNQFKRWQKILDASYDAEKNLNANTNNKLNLTHFILSLG